MEKNFAWIKIVITLLLLAFTLFPLTVLILFCCVSAWRWPTITSTDLNFEPWIVLFQDERVVSALWTTIGLGGLVVVLNLFIAIPAGKALAHYDFWGKSELDTALMLPILIPNLGLAMGIHYTMLKLGWANTLIGVAFVHLIPTLPYSIRMFRAGFEGLGVMWEEQARSLGISPSQIFWGIWFPLLLPTTQNVIFIVFIISLSQYILTALIGGGNVLTLALVYFPYFNSSNWAIIASFSLLFSLLPLSFLLLSQIIIYFLNPFPKRPVGRQ